jgi:hypothetical protein
MLLKKAYKQKALKCQSLIEEVGMKKNLRGSAAYETLSDPQKKECI